jgi:hypothetical protein
MANLEDQIVYSMFSPPVDYDPPVIYEKMIKEQDIMVAMRDGVKVSVDVYRPDTRKKVPALMSFATHFKDWQTPEEAQALRSQPAWSTLWMGHIEAGNTDYVVARGYAHVIGNIRGIGKAEDGGSPDYDAYDVIEWIAKQPWCDGQVGMMGLSAFGNQQVAVAKQNPPHLKAIMPIDPSAQYFQDRAPGGVIPSFPWMPPIVNANHGVIGQPKPLPPEKEALWKDAMKNPEYRMYAQVYNMIAMKGQVNSRGFNFLIDPFAPEGQEEEVDAGIRGIKIPMYIGSGWYAFTYKFHLRGAESLWIALNHFKNKSPRKLMFVGPTHLERPFHQYANEIVRWYDYWFKGVKNGIMDEPRVKFWVEGAEKWYTAEDWPIPGTKWTSLYLHTWERLRQEPFPPFSRESYDVPDTFVQMPPTLTNKVQKLRFLTDPLPEDTMVAGPMSLTLYAAINQEDTNWIVVVKDVGPDVGRRTARAAEREIPTDLPEKELTRGWLKASHRALDPKRSEPWKPWHPLTRKTQKPVKPGEIVEYQIDILPNANMFRKGHRICLEVTASDFPTGTAGYTDIEYIPYHICSTKTVVHDVYHSLNYPSRLLLPVIPKSAQQPIG